MQRFGDALNLNVHFHSLVLDGVYESKPYDPPSFHALPPPDDAEVARVVGQVARRIARLLEQRGLGPESDPREADPLAEEQPLLAQLYGASVAGRIAIGHRAGQRVPRVGDRIDPGDLPALEGERCATARGVSLHANVAVPARDRRRLERLCRYVARPPVATERLSRLEDGRLLYRLKHRWRDGTTHVVFEPQELLGKLVALVPARRIHLVRYHGILGPCASKRGHVIPCDPAQAQPDDSVVRGEPEGGRGSSLDQPAMPEVQRFRGTARHQRRIPDASVATAGAARVAAAASRVADGTLPRARRLAWAELLRRVFAMDVLECPRCGGRMRLLATIHSPGATQAILECLELPSRATHGRAAA